MSNVNNPDPRGTLWRLIQPRSMLARLFWLLGLGIVITNGLLLLISWQQDQRQAREASAYHLGFQLADIVRAFEDGKHFPVVSLEAALSWQIIEPQGRTRAQVLQSQGMAGWPEQLIELPINSPTPSQNHRYISLLAPSAIAAGSSDLNADSPRGAIAIAHRLARLSEQAAKSGQQVKLVLQQADNRILIFESDAYWRDEGTLSRYDFLLYVALVMFFMGLPFAAGYIFSPIDDLLRALRETHNESTPIKADGCEEVSEITFAVNRLIARLSRHMSERLSFVAAISHDLGVPATRLRLRAALIEDKQVRERLIDDTTEMSAMIADSLQYLRNEATEEAARVVDFHSLVESLYQDYLDTGADIHMNDDFSSENAKNKPLAYQTVHSMFTGSETQLGYRLHGPLTLTCKPRALRRALGNLLDNALKYGQSALLEIEADASSVAVKVSDRGPGIPEAEMERVTQPFYRLEKSRGRDTGGTGLGLAIVDSIVKDHDGFLAMENMLQGGLQVTIALPRNVPMPQS
jgi:signal transduction histidine kinase